MNESPSALSILVIGLGNMGLPMAANLVRHGFRVYGNDIRPEALAAATAVGVIPEPKVAAVAPQIPFVLLSLPTEEVLGDVLLGETGLLARCRPGTLVIDTTTTTFAQATRMAAAAAARRIAFMDSPVTGGTAGAIKGELTVMAGGEKEAFARAQPVLRAIGREIFHIGPAGHGQLAKLVNQVLMAAIYVSVSEAFGLAAELGADPHTVRQAVASGGGRSPLMERMTQGLAQRTLSTTGNLPQHGKDVAYALADAARAGVEMPVTRAIHEEFRAAGAGGWAHLSAGDIWHVWEHLHKRTLAAPIQQPPVTLAATTPLGGEGGHR